METGKALLKQYFRDNMVSTSTTNPGITSLFNPKRSTDDILNSIRNSGYGKVSSNKSSGSKTSGKVNAKVSRSKAKSLAQATAKSVVKKKSGSSSTPSQGDGSSSSSSSGDGITSLDDAASDELSGETGEGDSSGSSGTSPLLEGSMTFEELVGDICNGIDLIFATKRSTVVVTDYAGIYAEAKYLREKNHDSVKNEDIALWQLEEGTYELDVSEYGFYNTVNVHYNGGTITESYEDLVRVYGKISIDYYEKKLDKLSAQMKAKAYLAAHVRDFDMSVTANLLWDGDIDVGDIVTIENPLTMRDQIRATEGRDPEYFFVMGKSIEWEGEGPITGTIELRYGAKSPKNKEVPETGTSYSKSSSNNNTDIETAIDEVGKMAAKISYSGACQTHDCVKQKQTGDCFGMSDFIACELKSRGVEARIKGYPTFVPEHRSVQYQDSSGQWQNFPYRKYGCNSLFNDTSNIKNGHDVKCTCD